jgi:hypothetical protein
MTNTTPSRFGQINGTGDVEAIFLKLFAGEVLTEFEENVLFKDKHQTRALSNGKSASFPLIGAATGTYHTPGNFIDSQAINHAEKVITIDGELVAPTFIADIDEAKNHYDVRAPYAAELGRFLAESYDRNVARCMVLGARAASPLTGRAGGSVITQANMLTDAAVLEAALFSAAQTFDEKRVPSAQGRNAFFRPQQFYLLAQREKLLNKDIGGSGAIKDGTIDTVAGIMLHKTNHVPRTDQSADATVFTKYRANYAKTAGIISTPMAAATLSLLDLSMDSEYEIRRRGTFMLASYAVGHDWLRPDCAIELAIP